MLPLLEPVACKNFSPLGNYATEGVCCLIITHCLCGNLLPLRTFSLIRILISEPIA